MVSCYPFIFTLAPKELQNRLHLKVVVYFPQFFHVTKWVPNEWQQDSISWTAKLLKILVTTSTGWQGCNSKQPTECLRTLLSSHITYLLRRLPFHGLYSKTPDQNLWKNNQNRTFSEIKMHTYVACLGHLKDHNYTGYTHNLTDN